MGTTPNPDVCNRYGTFLLSWIYIDAQVREMNFGALLERLPEPSHTREALVRYSMLLDLKRLLSSADSPGHYARKDWSSCTKKPRPRLLHAATRNKDRSCIS
jgi:hypothetical protein